MTEPVRRWLELLARAGYAARGFGYVSIGLFALMAALDVTPETGGESEMVAMLSRWPGGRLWLAAVALGLAGFALWRLLQAAFDADGQGTKPKALASRAGQALSGVTYGLLALSVYRAFQGAAAAARGEGATDGAARVLDLPAGGALLTLAGVFVLGLGAAGLVRAFKDDFQRRLVVPPEMRSAAKWMGRLGYGGRGVALLPVGLFLLEAGLDRNAARARGLSDALQWLEGRPLGSLLLGLVAVGLIAFGAYAFLEGRYRRIAVPDSAAGLGAGRPLRPVRR